METRKTIRYRSRDHWLKCRAQDITSTESAALFGLSPYMTAFELWHRKKSGKYLDDENQFKTWGKRLQDAIAYGIAEDEGWKIRSMPNYMRIPELKLGASFDYQIGRKGLLEVKNVDSFAFKNDWLIEDGATEAPPHIEIQAQHQLAVSGRKFINIGALVGGNRRIVIYREPSETIINAIKAKVADFWKSIDEEREPAPNFSDDAAFLSELYVNAVKGKVLDARGDLELNALALEYEKCRKEKSDAENRQAAIKAEILTRIGDSAKVFGDEFHITAGTVGASIIEKYERKPYRMFRVSLK